MSSRLAFQTQLASIMEVLANAAVAEICKLVDDDYAVVSLQMSQCQRENKALKRKLHLLELKMARANAERRLRESSVSCSRPRAQISGGDRLRESSAGGVFERQVTLWSGRAAVEDDTPQLILPESMQTESPDVQLVETDEVLVKEEKVENIQRVAEPEPLPDAGELERVRRGSAGPRLGLEEQDVHFTSSQSQSQIQSRPGKTKLSSSRGVETDEDADVVLVKVEEVDPGTGSLNQTGLSIQEGLVESSTDDFRATLPPDETMQTSKNELVDLQDSGRAFSESAAPQLIPSGPEESSSAVAVQPSLPDTNTAASSTVQQQRSKDINPLNPEYSLFELETFFTRWAPDTDPGAPLLINDDSDPDQDGVIIVETESEPRQPAHAAVSSAARPSGSSRGTLRMPAPLSQPSWKRPAAHLLQQRCRGSRISPQSSSLVAVGNMGAAENISVSGISSTSRTLSCTAAPQPPLPVGGPTLADAAQHHTSALPHHHDGLGAGSLLAERRKKSYVCQACGKAFSGLSNLKAHERVHTGEKPFHCSICGKRFSEAGNLKKHQRVHTGEKPFSCDQCGMKFAWICNLRTHQQSATGCVLRSRGALGDVLMTHTST
ncbi:zinc finger protein 408 [Melanotaenia boesemani]|uniref:zinc finger protein 408 n=1 Tax=Melanotaenia boesemani TaxID=1250792 RepID=UPI001C0561D6|nr:zinc finger protein 408 [Melanotaenia boesemani]